jgi:hypothetical protein
MENEPHLRDLPGDLWIAFREDPRHAPEALALMASRYHGPAARDWIAEQGSRQPKQLAKEAKKTHARLARAGGAVTGIGGFATVVPDLAFAAWIQSRCIYFVAAAYGEDPMDPIRPAEQLVLQRIYDDVDDARRALDGKGKPLMVAIAQRRIRGENPKKGKNQTLVSRLALMAGKRAASRFSSRLVPGLAIATNAIGNERDTRVLADRAIRYYERR